MKNILHHLREIIWNPEFALGNMVIITILSLQIHENSICFHLLVSSLISFISDFYCSEYTFFTSLVGFIPRYLIFIDTILNEIIFLISLSDVHC